MPSPLKTVTAWDSKYEDHVSDTSRKRPTYSWWCVKVTTVTLECGHKKLYRGEAYPSKKARCAECPEVPC